MDIICGKCSKHFSSIEEARGHYGHCKASSKDEGAHFKPVRNSRITPEEWENLTKLINLPNDFEASDTAKSPNGIPSWLLALLCIFAFSLVGLGINL